MNPATAANGTCETHRPKFDHIKLRISVSIPANESFFLLQHVYARRIKVAAKKPNIPAIYMQIEHI